MIKQQLIEFFQRQVQFQDSNPRMPRSDISSNLNNLLLQRWSLNDSDLSTQAKHIINQLEQLNGSDENFKQVLTQEISNYQKNYADQISSYSNLAPYLNLPPVEFELFPEDVDLFSDVIQATEQNYEFDFSNLEAINFLPRQQMEDEDLQKEPVANHIGSLLPIIDDEYFNLFMQGGSDEFSYDVPESQQKGPVVTNPYDLLPKSSVPVSSSTRLGGVGFFPSGLTLAPAPEKRKTDSIIDDDSSSAAQGIKEKPSFVTKKRVKKESTSDISLPQDILKRQANIAQLMEKQKTATLSIEERKRLNYLSNAGVYELKQKSNANVASLELKVDELNEKCSELSAENARLAMQLAAFKQENRVLKEEISELHGNFGSMSDFVFK